MKCPRCEVENDAGARFCEDCGARLEATCPSCGTPITPGKKFCRSCGAALTTEPTGRFTSPESYTPKHLAEKILTSKAALEGECKQVTVLFADLKGSMELLADRDPEEARKLLDPVLEHMMEAVHRYEGTVNQVMGDGIMALFGAPLAHEDHAVRACYAALRMQESVKRYAEGVRREQGIVIRIRVGLNSGAVVVRAIGSDLHMDYSAIGQTTHLAARMEQLADAGAILLTPETLALAEGFVQVTSLGPMAVKGLAAPVEVYELTGVSAARSRLQAAATRGLSRFVGRDAEFEQLHRAVEHARQGRGQVAAVVGGPGVGKSRLTFELTHSRQFEGWLMLQAGAVSYGKGTSYLPVIDLLKNYFGIGDRESPHEIREKVTGRLLMLDRALEATLPAVLALLNVSGDDPQWQALDPPQRRQRMLDAVKRLLLREAQLQPLLVVFEDLHWIDSETQALLDNVVESLPPARLFLLVNYRPEYEHRWGSKTSYTQVRLDPLPPESALELLHGLLGEGTAIEPLTRILIERTEGNPFFLEESVRALVETKALVGERGAYRLAKTLTDIQVPPTVQAILAARIDRLSPEDKRLLQSAAVIGKDVPLILLAAIGEEREEDLRRGLAHLQAAEFLYEVRLFPDLDYTFKHALTHEVAYGSLLHERRRALHAQIVEAIEALHGDRLAEHVERLAHHALRGEAWGKAARYASEAGQKAAARQAHRDAVASFEQALAALARLPQTSDRQGQAIDLRLDIRASLVSLGDFASIPGHLRQAEPLAEALGDQVRQSAIAVSLAHCLWGLGQIEQGFEVGQRALELATRAGDLGWQRSARLTLGQVQYSLGNFEPAIAHFLVNIEMESLDETWRWKATAAGMGSVVSRRMLAQALAQVGRFPEAIARGTEAVEIAETVDHRYGLTNALAGLGFAFLRKGDAEQAIPLLERACELSRSLSFHGMSSVCAMLLGAAYALSGRSAEAVLVLADPMIRPVSFSWTLAESWLLCGRMDEASRLGPKALEIVRAQKRRPQEALALRVLGEIAAGREPPDPEAAEGHYRQALRLAVGLGMRPLVAHCHLGLGKLYRRTGQLEEAREHLTTATTMYREMDMRFWLEQAEQELRELA